MTNEQRAAWLKGRRTGIGGSDVAAVLGLNPWKTPLDVWNDKLGLSEDKEMSEPAYWGTVLEDTVAKEFQLRTGKRVQMNRLLIRDCIFNTDQVALIAWTRDENVLTVSLSSGKYIEFKDFPESEWKRLRETLGFAEEKE